MTEEALTPIPREARAFQGQPAGLVSRMIVNAIDAAVVAGLVVALYLGVNAARFFLDPRGFAVSEPRPLLTMTVFLTMLGLYLAVSWALTGRTYGCHVMGLRVVGRGGRPVRPVVSLARGALCAFIPIGLFWCAVSPEKRSLQDVLLRTRVIYDWTPRRVKPAR